MQRVSILSPKNFHSTPWKNGLGETTELSIAKIPASDDFYWRLSIASVTTNDSFSDFSHYDRTLVLLDGQGITLSHSNGVQDRLSNQLDQASFKGEYQTTPKLHDGAITDFNVMTRREHCRSKVVTLTQAQELEIDGDILFIYAVTDTTTVSGHKMQNTCIEKQHLLQINNPGQGQYLVAGGAVIVVQIYFISPEI